MVIRKCMDTVLVMKIVVEQGIERGGKGRGKLNLV